MPDDDKRSARYLWKRFYDMAKYETTRLDNAWEWARERERDRRDKVG